MSGADLVAVLLAMGRAGGQATLAQIAHKPGTEVVPQAACAA